MNALLLLAAGILLGLEALHQWSNRVTRDPDRSESWAGQLVRIVRTPWGVGCALLIALLNVPPRNGAGWVLWIGLAGWVTVRMLGWRRARTHRGSRWAALALIFLACMPLAWGGASLFAAGHLLGRRKPPHPEPLPAVDWADFEELRIETPDELELGAWWIGGREDSDTVILLHGNKGARTRYLHTAQFLGQIGCSVLMLTLRAHGDSEGELHDYGRGARLDLIAAVEEARRRRPDDPIVVLGRSLGAAAALFAAEELGHRVDAYLLEAPFLNLTVAIHDRVDRRFPPPLNWLAVQGLLAAGDLWMEDPSEHAPGELLPTIPDDIPVLMLFGRTDRQAPHERFEEVLKKRPETEVELLDLGGHRPMLPRDPTRYAAIWKRWRGID